MTAETNNLILELLRAIRADIAGINGKLDEHTNRLGRLEVSLAGLRRDIALSEETTAEHSLRFDRMNARIERIERRLELI
jgi:predicted trehalose synthase